MGDRHVQSCKQSTRSVSGVVSDVNKKQILYIHANNLYGWAMSQYLPTDEFGKLQLCWPSVSFPEEYELEKMVEDLRFIPNHNDYGFFIECDLEYPVEIKEKTKTFPLCPYQTKEDPELLTFYMNSVNQPNYKPTSKPTNYLM